MKKIFTSNYTNFFYKEHVLRTEAYLLFIFLGIKILLAVLLLKEGFVGLSGDDFFRQLLAYEWSKEAYFSKTIWPPLQFYILGSVIKIFLNIRESNLMVNGLFSSLTLISYYFLVRLFFKREIALLSTAIAVVLPWQLKLSLSGLSEPIYHFFLITSLWCLFKWEASEKKYCLILCALSLLLANMSRTDSWVFYTAISIYILAHLFLTPSYQKHWKIVLFTLFLPSTFIFLWILLGNLHTNLQLFINDFSQTSSGDSSHFIIRFLRYPGYLFLVSPLVCLAGIGGLIRCFKSNIKLSLKYLLIPGLYFIGMIAVSLITGSDPLAAPLRMVVPFAYLAIPMSLILFTKKKKMNFGKIAYGFAIMVFFSNLFFVFNFDRHDFADIKEVSRILVNAQSRDILKKEQKVFFETNLLKPYYYDGMALMILSNQPNSIIIYDATRSDFPFEKAVKNVMRENAGAFIACSQEAKRYLSEIFPFTSSIGVYEIFWAENDSDTIMKAEDILSLPAKNPVGIYLGKGIQLSGYSVGRGKFSFGITTQWKINDSVQLSLKIQYKLIPWQGGDPLILTSRTLKNTPGKKETFLTTDWQALILPPGAPPGKYAIAVRLLMAEDDTVVYAPDISLHEGWYPLTEVNLIISKRDTINRLIKGKLNDYLLGFNVITSLF
jgi:hypothetical protein